MAGFTAKLARGFVSHVLPDIRKLAAAGIPLITPAPNSPEGKIVPEVVALYGHPGIRFLKFFCAFPYVVKTIYYARQCNKGIWMNPPHPAKVADEALFRELEKYARALGASAIGYTKVPGEYIFRNRALLFQNAIVLTMDMRKDRIQRAPTVRAGQEVWRTYAALSKTVCLLAKFLRERGYAAQPDLPIGGSTNFTLLAQKAGLGCIGKHGLLISEGNGPSQRIAAVYTSIENLPFTDHEARRYAWIAEFCDVCNRCVRECPTQAIYRDPMIPRDGHRQCIDYKKCVVVFARTLGCSICIKECVFFKRDAGQIKASYKRHHREGQEAPQRRWG